ncbi:unnamed protein product [Symbiodinium sp. CCMP2592]|nr:unnamed protein product [Symbiodinium sp. CCMP2592]
MSFSSPDFRNSDDESMERITTEEQHATRSGPSLRLDGRDDAESHTYASTEFRLQHTNAILARVSQATQQSPPSAGRLRDADRNLDWGDAIAGGLRYEQSTTLSI